jgi:hypothetical protein
MATIVIILLLAVNLVGLLVESRANYKRWRMLRQPLARIEKVLGTRALVKCAGRLGR